jgi:hypothetical protein
MEQTRKMTYAMGLKHFVLDKSEYQGNCGDYRAVSNIVRCRLAMENPDMLWLDTDVLIDKEFDFSFTENKVYFGKGVAGKPEAWAFYVNGRSDFFRAMWEEYERKKPDTIWWFAGYVQAHRNETALIPEGYMTHLMMSRAINAKEGFTNYGNRRFTIRRDRINNEITVDIRGNR